jgi:hypothetical protein
MEFRSILDNFDSHYPVCSVHFQVQWGMWACVTGRFVVRHDRFNSLSGRIENQAHPLS